jgi:hypothetical protein
MTQTSFAILVAILTLTLTQTFAQNKKEDKCKLQGAVYFESSAGMADHIIYIEQVENFADLNVCKTESLIGADAPGLWYVVSSRGQADFSVYVETNKSLADFSVYYVSQRGFAGCKK